MAFGLAGMLLLQQVVAYSSPPSGDTAGYWQQRVHYTMQATLDEDAQLIRGRGTMRYVNASPDTLGELYFHQYLNAFRPRSRWSAADEREYRERFQNLAEPHYGFERLTSYDWPGETRGPGLLVARGDGSDETLVQVQYPLAPDSTVAHVPLPVPLAPGDSLLVSFEWEARPSTVIRRQGRRGRQWDLAHWYPKVAVYDRLGWQFQPLVPNSEFYGEFGVYDVTLVVRDDQVIGATGVPVSGDPGWERVRRFGEVHHARDAYGPPPPDDTATVPAGYKAVRFVARDVHHFAWTVSPLYRYEGMLYDGRVPVHVLYRPGDEAQWGGGQALERFGRALEWLERLFGPYGYPQVTATHRLDAGATEFPMLTMNSSASQGLILHELGHVYAYGMLANNEWRAGWMDEGLTDYQTAWAQNLTWHERARGLASPPAPRLGYRRRALAPESRERNDMQRYERLMLGRAEPVGTPSQDFNEFASYQAATYTTAEAMFAALRDAMGDSSFVRFHRVYFARWKFKHVDEPAMRRAAEDACGCELDWFFDQWVHRVGLLDYALGGVEERQIGSEWLTNVKILQRGDYAHPMPVGVRTDSGWTIVRGAPGARSQELLIRTSRRPLEVRLDPHQVTDDWDRRNDVEPSWSPFNTRSTRTVFDWPFLDQRLRDRTVVRYLPIVWYDDRDFIGVQRVRSNYLGFVDRYELAFGSSSREVDSDQDKLDLAEVWGSIENPGISGRARIGLRLEAWHVDGLTMLGVRKRWDRSPFLVAQGPQRSLSVALKYTKPYHTAWTDPLRWTPASVVDASVEGEYTSPERDRRFRIRLLGGHGRSAFLRTEVEMEREFPLGRRGDMELRTRLFGGAVLGTPPLQRSLGLSALDPIESFANPYLRADGAPLVRRDVGFVPLGHGALRGYSLLARTDALWSANLELARLVRRPSANLPGVWLTVFGDLAYSDPGASRHLIGDAGVGVAIRGRLYDLPVGVRFDLPLYVSDPQLAVVRSRDGDRFRLRWSFSIER